MEQLSQYIKTENAVLVAALYCLGIGLRAIRKIPNQYIPFFLTICSIFLSCLSAYSRLMEYPNLAAALYEGAVQGILCAGMSVYVNEVVKHCPGCERKEEQGKSSE